MNKSGASRNLVIICAGDSSLHTQWEKRDYELWVIFFGNDPLKRDNYKLTADRFFEIKGLKCALLKKICFFECLLEERFDFSAYDFIWVPDDDLEFLPGDSPAKLFGACAELNADIFQPAIHNEYISRGWESTRKIEDVYAHRTNIVELMAIGFSGKAFKDCFLTALHACEFVESGWGIEPVFKNIGESLYGRYLNSFVIDAFPIIHTRPSGSGVGLIHSKGFFESRFFPQIEANRMKTLKTYRSLAEVHADKTNYLHIDSSSSRIPFYEALFNNWRQQR